MDIFKISGIIGLLLITAGVLVQSRKQRDHAFIAGGFFLLVYSVYRGDVIFAVLQVVFILATIYDEKRKKRSKTRKKRK